jgi:hypothetical protein
MAEFPTLEGEYRLSAYWEIVLPCALQRRFEEGSLVLWRPGILARVKVWENDHDEPKEVRLQRVRQGIASGAFDEITETNGAVIRYAYRSKEESSGATAFHGFTFGNSGHVQMTVHFDHESDVETAQKMWRGPREVEPPTGSCGG